MRLSSTRRQTGFTLPEVMVTALILGVFFAGMFEVSGICLRYISASKENISAVECVQDRIEQLRNLDFTDLTNTTYLAVTPSVPAASPSPSPSQRRNLTVPANASALAKQATEVVKISTYANGAATTPSVTFTRPAGAFINTAANFSDTNVAPTITWSSGDSAFPSTTTTVQIDVTYNWTAVLGRRAQTQTSSTIVAAGTKK